MQTRTFIKLLVLTAFVGLAACAAPQEEPAPAVSLGGTGTLGDPPGERITADPPGEKVTADPPGEKVTADPPAERITADPPGEKVTGDPPGEADPPGEITLAQPTKYTRP
jgi:hypothetical protein